ncbi:MAG: hypothetical protein LBC12_02460, partial [Nitrososphaerota archaeon]|nr:hypothetical protein [Nitrososphaerota archaeon]
FFLKGSDLQNHHQKHSVAHTKLGAAQNYEPKFLTVQNRRSRKDASLSRPKIRLFNLQML